MILSAVLSGTAGALLFFLLLVLVAMTRSAKRLECARLRDELVDAARLGQLDVSQPRVFWLIDWFDRVADSGRPITSARHSRKRAESTSLTVSLQNALSPHRQLAPVGPNFPQGPSWPGEQRAEIGDGAEIEARAVRYQRSQLGRRADRATPAPATAAVPHRSAPKRPPARGVSQQAEVPRFEDNRAQQNWTPANRVPTQARPGSVAQFRAATPPAGSPALNQFRLPEEPAESLFPQAFPPRPAPRPAPRSATTVEVPKPGPPKPAPPKPGPPKPSAPPKSAAAPKPAAQPKPAAAPRPAAAKSKLHLPRPSWPKGTSWSIPTRATPPPPRVPAARLQPAQAAPQWQPAQPVPSPLPRLEPPLLEPARLQPRRLDPRRPKVSRQEASRPDPRRQDVRRQAPSWDQRVDVTGHSKPRGGLVPVTDSIPVPTQATTLDVDAAAAAAVAAVSGAAEGKRGDEPGDLKDQIFALPS